MVATPPTWGDEQLTVERLKAVQLFRDERMTEPLDQYLAFYEAAFQTFAEVLEETEDLRRAHENAEAVLTDKQRQHLCRYLASPRLRSARTISERSLTAVRADPSSHRASVRLLTVTFPR